jgi:endoglucanase
MRERRGDGGTGRRGDGAKPIRSAIRVALLAAASGIAVNGVSPDRPIAPSPRPPVSPVAAAIRVNQVGYLPREPKIGIVQSRLDLRGKRFAVLSVQSPGRSVAAGVLGEDRGAYGAFAHHYPIDFSGLQRPGLYRLRLAGGLLSPPFRIGDHLYRGLPRTILAFFRVQRCGNTEPLGHGPCHLTDAVARSGPETGRPVDLTGGWHDAGDYLKFAATSSYVTLLLLECASHYPRAVPSNARGGSPLLDEARVGVEWLLKLRPRPEGFYYQVGSESDHDEWRRPEGDDERLKQGAAPDHPGRGRPALFGAGANVAGRAAAALALAARLYRSTEPDLAHRCAETAVAFYQCGLQHPGVLTTQPADFYPERGWRPDMALAAALLYRLTRQGSYLHDAVRFDSAAGPGEGALSLYSIHGLAHVELFPLAPHRERRRILKELREDCERARAQSRHPFRLGTALLWGTAGRACGAGNLCLLAAPLVRDPSLTGLAAAQRDYLLGCNPFGVSFLIGAGERYPHHPHHPLAQLGSLPLAGAVVGGPAPLEVWQSQPMREEIGKHYTPDEPGLQSPAAVYHDDVGDWVTNEPALDYAADALFLLAAYSG